MDISQSWRTFSICCSSSRVHRRIGASCLLVHAALFSLGGEIADGGRALLGDERAVLIGMNRVAAREHGRAGEFGVGDLVAVETALLEQPVAGPDAGAVEPPFLAAEDQMRAGNAADAGRLHAVAKSMQTVKDCGATMPPNLELRANSSSQWMGFG